MTSYFRLFAGLTSLMSDLCLRHLSASGPAGTLESSVAMSCAARELAMNVEGCEASALHGGDTGRARLELAREDGGGNRQISGEIREAEYQRDRTQAAGPPGGSQAK